MTPARIPTELAWFLGPKAENAAILEELFLQVLRDYTHWRRNYFPADPILINKSLRTEFEAEHDALETLLAELLAQLRRNFPFYSPRYIAHELSDTLMAATVGYTAGMLYNPNNVTPEAAPVTTELEIEVTSGILAMLGFQPPPGLPPRGTNPETYYAQKSKDEFGWAHLTSGGTVANIEALWVARQVRYFPLAVKAVAADKGLELRVKLPSGASRSIQEVDEFDLLLLKPNESIYLLARYLEALRRAGAVPPGSDLAEVGWRYLDEKKCSTTHGLAATFERFPPVVLVAGSRHYSIAKAVNILGIGQANIVAINTNASFRLDVAHLDLMLQKVLKERRVPLCVVASAGTTEEGAVDPIHGILDLRERLERERDASFWLHIDAAWGGFIRSLFCLEPLDVAEALAVKLSRALDLQRPSVEPGGSPAPLVVWHDAFSTRLVEVAEASRRRGQLDADEPESTPGPSGDEAGHATTKAFVSSIQHELVRARDLLQGGDYKAYARRLADIRARLAGRDTTPVLPSFALDLGAITDWLSTFVSEQLKIGSSITINWPDKEVASAFLAFPKADSITVDPHKLGYAPYPAGCVAFRNDRVRSFILQAAPYITSAEHDVLIHLPPRHLDVQSGAEEPKVVVQSFSPFMLEGSRPGAVASGLWLAMRSAPFVPRRHGLIVRSSLLSARALYEWLTRWDSWCKRQEIESEYVFVPLTPQKPDTNLVTFVVKAKIWGGLAKTNQMTSAVYETFSIQAELGEREYSYGQPFFLSKTRMGHGEYPAAALEEFFDRCGLNSHVRRDYEIDGLVVLRATVMNPYILPARTVVDQDFCRLFLEELARSASRAFRLAAAKE